MTVAPDFEGPLLGGPGVYFNGGGVIDIESFSRRVFFVVM